MTELSSSPASLRDAFASSLDWWHEAGVEEHVADAPGAWLREREAAPESVPAVAEAPVQQPPEPPRRAALSRFIEDEPDGDHPGDPAQWPGDLAAFRKWWMESEAVDPPGAFPRVSPRGEAGAPVMLILDQPQGEVLLDGPAQTLASNMLRAMGFAGDAAYFASILPRHTLRPEWRAVAKAGYGKLLLHHIALARPQRIIACGDRVWSLLAHDTAQEPATLTTIPLDSSSIPAFAIPDMQTLLREPRSRAQTWNRWLDWSDSPR